MAAEDRHPRAYLTFAEKAAKVPKRFSLFALVRGLSARAMDKPPVGRSKQPNQDIVRLKQIPHTHFPAPTLGEVDIREGRAEAGGYWLGLTGPMSPLPLHFTEFAAYERRYAKTRPFGDFLDLLAGRFLQLFYRAWAVSQPAVQADRPEHDRFASYVDRLTGATEGSHERSAFPSVARLHYAALFASRRSAGAIRGGLAHLLDLKVGLREFVPVLQRIEPGDQTRLGTQHNRLGEAVIGSRAYLVADNFEVKIHARDLGDFRRLQPDGALFRVAAEALDALAPSHLEWSITLCLPQSKVEPARLDGNARLGWSSWVGTDPKMAANDDVRTDVHLRRSALTFGAAGRI
ncbi:type VI secretion system baseplate subunit TssG [Erythrobacter sp. JK5]|uniref:type VI secretion system baseplate subunit TssG n=1 Tax=Erythrobacter sp. JK5 TaxID=2829500 RepID=UPI001BADB1C4|nr:type VI secretion system baseplate subunit TssG [Erythrobacter sp. JK5]QUL36769.1 type VI secretion system baseplate subunit TssG [Erythrobacter sp. JK5]